MAKAYVLSGYFLLGVSCTGLFSFTAYAFPQLRAYGLWLIIVASLLFIAAALADDFLTALLGLNYQEFLGAMITAIALLFIGILIQWVR